MTDTYDNKKNSHNNNNLNNETINHEQFEEMRDLLEEDFADLVQTYITDSKERIEILRNAQSNDDNTNGFEAAHALKGASANLGATQLVMLSEQLQKACKANTISEQATLIENLAAALKDVEQETTKRLAE